jgi:flagellar biosynthesis GTPase FlhF
VGPPEPQTPPKTEGPEPDSPDGKPDADGKKGDQKQTFSPEAAALVAKLREAQNPAPKTDQREIDPEMRQQSAENRQPEKTEEAVKLLEDRTIAGSVRRERHGDALRSDFKKHPEDWKNRKIKGKPPDRLGH